MLSKLLSVLQQQGYSSTAALLQLACVASSDPRLLQLQKHRGRFPLRDKTRCDFRKLDSPPSHYNGFAEQVVAPINIYSFCFQFRRVVLPVTV